MKTPALLRGIALTGALALFAFANLHAASISAPSKITAATVYQDRAIVTRTASVALEAGEQELLFENLPLSLDEASLRAFGSGLARVTILDVQARRRVLEINTDERVRALEAELKTLQQNQRTLNDTIALLQRQAELLNRITTTATTPIAPTKDSAAPARPTIDEWQKLLEFSESGHTRFTKERQTLDLQLTENAEKIAAVQQRLNDISQNRSKTVRDVAVRLLVETAGTLDLSIAYGLPDASWQPTYDARLDTATGKVALGYFGIVRQTTGEDWKNVELTLSTARPSLGGAAPALDPWFLRITQPIYKAGSSLAMTSVDETFTFGVESKRSENSDKEVRDASLARKALAAANQATAAVQSAATSATFKLPMRTDIPSDRSPHRVGITNIALTAELSHQATPKLAQTAFLEASVANSSDYPLLAGALAVFLDGDFVANASLKTVMPGEKFELALGADEGVRVERKQINRFVEETGLVDTRTRITYEYLITVQNNRKQPAKLVLKDQLPISQAEAIVVTQLTPGPKDLKPEKDGTLKWTLDLKPGEKREIPLKFSISHPKEIWIGDAQ